jgi:ankyrin repeat protein
MIRCKSKPFLERILTVGLVLFFCHISYPQKEEQDANSMLIMAAFEGNIDRCDSLLKAGADVNTITPEGITPLMYASQNGFTQLAGLLIKYGALVDARPFDGVTALIAAVRADRQEVAELLIRNNAAIDVADYYGGTPLIYTAAYNLDTLADMLLYYGADVNFRSPADSSAPLNISALNGSISIAINFISQGADVNATDVLGYTPLMIAIQQNDTAMVHLLLDNGADIDILNYQGYSALHIASEKGESEIIKLLLSAGVNPNLPDRSNVTALKIARLNENYQVVKILRKNGANPSMMPVFNKLIFSFDPNFSIDDVFFGGHFGLSDANYKTSCYLGFGIRVKAVAVLKKVNENLSYQFLENRTFFSAGLEKRFDILISGRTAKGIFAGVKELYTYGSYHGTAWKPGNAFITVPLAGIYIQSKYVGAKLNYEYLNFKTVHISPHRLNISLWFAISLVKNKYNDKVVDWL